MAKKKDAGENLDAPLQSDEVREKVLAQSTAGPASAVGLARTAEEDAERIKNLDSRGSTLPIAGGDQIQSDYPANDTDNQPIGAQAQPANFATNGSLPLNMVPSPSGPVPVSAVTSNPEDAAKRVQESLDSQEKHILRSGFERLSRNKVESMSGNDLRAVASDRGYDLGDHAGNRTTRQRFLKAQEEDEALPAEGEEGTRSPADGGEPST